jgi:hypothetical protein
LAEIRDAGERIQPRYGVRDRLLGVRLGTVRESGGYRAKFTGWQQQRKNGIFDALHISAVTWHAGRVIVHFGPSGADFSVNCATAFERGICERGICERGIFKRGIFKRRKASSSSPGCQPSGWK